MELFDLKVNSMVSPVIGGELYFSWRIRSEKRNMLQRSYRIRIIKENAEVFDSGEFVTREQSFIRFEGIKLESSSRYMWEVTVTDNYGRSAKAASYFETALLYLSDWKAKWAECSFKRESANEYKFGNSYPPVLFERSFKIKKKVEKAIIYCTAHGVYRLSINDRRADDREFAPEFTSYEKTLYYQTYDITRFLSEGKNILSMYVGDGWYFSTQAGPVMKDRHDEPSVLFQLQVKYTDGTEEMFVSDEKTTCKTEYIVYSDLYQGEKQDFTLKESDRSLVAIKEYGYSFLKVQPIPKILPIMKIKAEQILVTPKGETVVDFGQVLAGRAVINIDIPRGESAIFEYFEELDKDGNYINTMFAPQKDTLVSGGLPVMYEALFTFHGFRYIRVSGESMIRTMKKEDFTAVLLSTEKENRGNFSCSDERLNRLYKNIRFSQYNNMMSIPTDCPSREKAGWTGDILVYARTSMLNEDMTSFLSGWLGSVRDDQAEDGAVMIVSPYMKLYDGLLRAQTKKFGDDGISGVAGWSDAIVWVPYEMYHVTGNISVLKENYNAMVRWTEYIVGTASRRRSDTGIPYEYDRYLWNTGFHFGEWLVPSRPLKEGESSFDACPETAYYIAPFFGYMTIKKMVEISAILGNAENAEKYEKISLLMKDAIQNGIMRRGLMPEKYMGAYILAFGFDLVPEDLKDVFYDKLISLIEQNGRKLDTGFLATPYILDVLYNLGRKDLAYGMLFANECPSWLYQVENGATTIWESWDADDARKGGRYVSYDHYAFGCVDEFIFKRICGIDSDTAGFTHILIEPDTCCRLSCCRREFMTEAGSVLVEWCGKHIEVIIPPNVTATVIWNGKRYEIGSGQNFFE